MARLMSLVVFPLSFLVIFATAKDPGDSDFYNTVGNHYRGNSCQEESLIWPDPVWGIGGYCSLLDYWDQEDPIVSYKVVRQYCGCNTTLYTTRDCTGPGILAPLNKCVSDTEGKPFESVFALCPFSYDWSQKK